MPSTGGGELVTPGRDVQEWQNARVLVGKDTSGNYRVLGVDSNGNLTVNGATSNPNNTIIVQIGSSEDCCAEVDEYGYLPTIEIEHHKVHEGNYFSEFYQVAPPS